MQNLLDNRKPSSYFLPTIAIAIVLLTILFFVGGPNYHSPRSYKYFWNLGHILYFALFPLLLSYILNNREHKPAIELITILAITLLLGTLVELLQYNFERTPDFNDIFRNIIGASIAICFFLPIRSSIPKITLFIARGIIISLVLLQFYPIVISLIDEYHARRDFPVISDFEGSLQVNRWVGGATLSIEDLGNSNNSAMRVDLTTEQYSGVALKYFPMNWMQYQKFQFRIYNPLAETIKITCRIHDKKHTQGRQEYHDRFNRSYTIQQGWNTVTINLVEVQQAPEQREINLTQIYGVGIFASRLIHPRTIYLDDVRLL